MKTVAIVSKPAKQELRKLAPELIAKLKARKYDVVLDMETASYAAGERSMERSQLAQEKLALVIVLGGDGTLLAASRVVAKSGTPILAVNLGSLGFLTEVRLEEIYSTLDAFENNTCGREFRAMLECKVMRRGQCVSEFLALNDIVITKGTIARMAEVDVKVNGEFVANYKADGVIVGTPTGSTAYSLAAGGPVLGPDVEAFVITPVSPHALTNRPLVVKDSAEVALMVRGAPEETFLTVDGQTGMPTLEGDEVICCKSEHKVQLVKLAGRSFFDVLRTKLKWGER